MQNNTNFTTTTTTTKNIARNTRPKHIGDKKEGKKGTEVKMRVRTGVHEECSAAIMCDVFPSELFLEPSVRGWRDASVIK